MVRTPFQGAWQEGPHCVSRGEGAGAEAQAVLGFCAWTCIWEGAASRVWALCRSFRKERSSGEGAASMYLAGSTFVGSYRV